MNVERILRSYKHGVLTEAELFIELGQLITPANADAVLSCLPSDVIGVLHYWVSEINGPGVKIGGSNLTREEAEEQESKLEQAIPIMRDWCAAHATK